MSTRYIVTLRGHIHRFSELRLANVSYRWYHHVPACIYVSGRADGGVRSLVGLIGDKLELLRDLGVDMDASLL